MRWTPGGISSDIDDARGSSGGGFGGFGLGGGSLGCGGVIILLVLSLLFHRNFFALFDNSQAPSPRQQVNQPVQESPDEHKEMQFVSFVLDDVQSTWDKLLPEQAGTAYHHARLTPFRDEVRSGCGFASAASGPFYCPDDEHVYIDLSFYDELRGRFGAPGDFAQAYVIAHEVGHHVQHILGISDKVQTREDSVRLELQADCYAGVWAHSTQQRGLLEEGDVDEAMNAAAAVGDDRIQRMAGRRVNPETWTHGSAAERSTWFRRGFDSGRISSCDTFAH
ncbi:MAG TPA: neutral zinc metallopeptidase [Thermoanaerobaculia bacterium]|nr:neutral zinc metallopeptidase [Thermoanaerobaculia bacterium]